VLYTVDLARGSPLIVRSLLGPSPRSGSRFYGIGNELEIALTVLLLVGIAAGLRQRRQGAVGAGAFAIGGLALAAIIGAGRLGADVGGVFTVGSGAAVATALMLPWRPRARTWVLVALTPFLGIGLLALIDLASGGNGHFSRSVLHAHHTSDLWHTVKRRYEVAWNILKAAYTPIVSAISLLAVAYAARYRARIYAAVGDDPAWRAALIGGVVSSVVGSLANDSGPVLLLIGIVALASATAYLRGGADPAAEVRA
jgi:hypothetical protein